MVTRSTSKAAFASAKKRGPTNKQIAFATVKGSKDGLTADEVAELMNVSILTVRPTMTGLFNDGLITDSGDRRQTTPSGKNAIVWVAL